MLKAQSGLVVSSRKEWNDDSFVPHSLLEYWGFGKRPRKIGTLWGVKIGSKGKLITGDTPVPFGADELDPLFLDIAPKSSGTPIAPINNLEGSLVGLRFMMRMLAPKLREVLPQSTKRALAELRSDPLVEEVMDIEDTATPNGVGEVDADDHLAPEEKAKQQMLEEFLDYVEDRFNEFYAPGFTVADLLHRMVQLERKTADPATPRKKKVSILLAGFSTPVVNTIKERVNESPYGKEMDLAWVVPAPQQPYQGRYDVVMICRTNHPKKAKHYEEWCKKNNQPYRAYNNEVSSFVVSDISNLLWKRFQLAPRGSVA